MSKTETKEIYAVYKQNVNRCFDETEKNITQYIQAASNLQQEFATAYKNAVESSIQLQQEIAAKSGLNANLPPSYLKAVNDATEEIVKTSTVQNRAVLSAMEATRQNVKTFNENTKAFTDMNANVWQSWFSAWTPTRN